MKFCIIDDGKTIFECDIGGHEKMAYSVLNEEGETTITYEPLVYISKELREQIAKYRAIKN